MSTTEDTRVAASPTPAGWYPDPWGQHGRRYWDGDDWTGITDDAPVAAPARNRFVRAAVVGAAGLAVVLAAVSFTDRREKLAILAVVLVLPLALANLAQLARVGPALPRSRFASVAAWVLVVSVVAVGGYRGFQRPSTCTDRIAANARLAGCDLSTRDLTTYDLHGADLSGANLSGADLNHVDLAGANLSNATLANTNLSGARLDDTDLRGAVIDGTTLESATLDHAKLADTTLRNVDAAGVRLPGADLTSAQIVGSDLTGGVLRAAALDKTVVDGTTLDGAMFDDATLTDAQWSNVHAPGASLAHADLTRATIKASNLMAVALDGARLQRAVIEDTSFVSGTLTGTDFTDATLTRVAFEQVDLTGAKGLSDQALAGAFSVAPADVASTLSARGLFLDAWGSTYTAAESVCAGTPSPSAATTPANGTWVVVVNQGPTSFEWPTTPPALRYVELVVCVGDTTTADIDECGPYVYADGSPAHPITRYRESVTVRVVNPTTAAVVSEQTFAGPDPDPCPMVVSASTYRMGGDLDVAAVEAGYTQMVAAAGG